MSRHAGVLVPLSAATSEASWGIGDIGDLARLADWLVAAGFDRVMILPIGTMPPGESSPYSAVSTMAIDPIYIALDEVEDFTGAGGIGALEAATVQDLDRLRGAGRVPFDLVRRVKTAALDLACARFLREEWAQRTSRAADFAGYLARERWWLDDYALFEALTATHGTSNWRSWPLPIRQRDPRAMDEARRLLASDVLRHQYLQWVAESQWQRARAAARTRGVTVVGDLPFAMGVGSPDVWARADEFQLDVSTGVPPDAFSADGQDWRLPLYHWDAIARADDEGIRRRARRMAALYDAFRLDHLVGFYRTYGRPEAGDAFFSPPDEPSQLRQGERLLRIFRDSGAEILAEDLGSIPAFVDESLVRLGVPGMKVIRWERRWQDPGGPYEDPRRYPALSVAVTGTHDTEPLAVWWAETTDDERAAAAALDPLAARGVTAASPWSDQVRDGWLELAYVSGSNDVFLPIQDVFGWRDRINTPATISEANWTWRLPWRVDRLAEQPEAIERAQFCRALRASSGR